MHLPEVRPARVEQVCKDLRLHGIAHACSGIVRETDGNDSAEDLQSECEDERYRIGVYGPTALVCGDINDALR